MAGAAGLDFVHFNGMSGEYYFPEMMGGGAALLDYDGDGDLDAYLVQGAMLGADKGLADALFPPRHPPPLSDRLYRNDLAAGNGGGAPAFADVTRAAGLVAAGYGMGVAAGDYDGDGRTDLYVTRFGSNQLLRNAGGGRFTDVTRAAGVDDPRWSVPALFFDFDRDGWLDLYVGNYLDFTLGTHKRCFDAAGGRDWCGPQAYAGVTDRLFRNRGDGRFEDISLPTGVGRPAGKALGAVAADLDGDGWLDLYVANDGEPNFLWRNRGDGSFEEVALAAGCAVNADGLPEASMGVDAGDYDGDGDLDLFMTHLSGESNTLFANQGGGGFRDLSAESGLALPSWPLTGFGTRWFDFDNDGRLDLVTANGAVRSLEALVRQGDPYPLHQPKQLFRNLGGGRFAEVSADAGPAFAPSEVGRGIAFGDLDEDGDTDLLVVNSNGPARLLVNRAARDRAWIGLRLAGGGPGRQGEGARVEVLAPGRPPIVRRAATDGGYASAHDPRVLVGLGEVSGPVGVRIAWPDGRAGEWRGLRPGRYYTLVEGTEGPLRVHGVLP